MKKWLGSKSCDICGTETSELWFDTPIQIPQSVPKRKCWAFTCLDCYREAEGSWNTGQVYNSNFEKIYNVVDFIKVL